MASNSPKFFQYMKLIGQLKQVERTGWVRNKVKDPESVAEHMYRMAMMAFALPSNSGLDRDKCIKIALVHDMAESIVGDITPWCGISKDVKRKREHEATSHIASLLPDEGGKEMVQLWLEYENQSSPEAKFVKDLDKFEMLFQAFEYEKLHDRPNGLQEFYDHTRDNYQFTTDLVGSWSKDLLSQRDGGKSLGSSGSSGPRGSRRPPPKEDTKSGKPSTPPKPKKRKTETADQP